MPAAEVSISYMDVNGLGASNRFWVADDGDAAGLPALLKKLTNAQIKNASYATPIDISGLASNNAVAANNESAEFKMAITFSAPPLGAGLPRQTVTIQIPAPVGSYVNGQTGDPNNADIQALVGLISTRAGTPTNQVDRVAYVR